MTREDVQIKALEKLLTVKRGTIALSGGTGKTFIGLKHINTIFDKEKLYLVVAPKKSIIKTWLSEAKKFKFEHLLRNINFVTYLSLTKENFNIYDTIYLDECHSLTNNHIEWLKNFKGGIIGLTGTPPKPNTDKGFIVNRFCPVIYSYTTDEAIKHSILNDYQIIVHYINLNPIKDIKMEKNGKSWMTSEVQSYNYWTTKVETSFGKMKQIASIQRMKVMQSFKSKEDLAYEILTSISQIEKCLCFANSIEQAEKLSKFTYHSKNAKSLENLELFKNNKIKNLCAVEQLNEGVNIPNLKNGVILHSFGNERKASQKIFRFLRLNPKDKATIHILCYKNTIDEKWVKEALSEFNQDKIRYV